MLSSAVAYAGFAPVCRTAGLAVPQETALGRARHVATASSPTSTMRPRRPGARGAIPKRPCGQHSANSTANGTTSQNSALICPICAQLSSGSKCFAHMEDLLSTMYSSVVDHAGWVGAITPGLSESPTLLNKPAGPGRSRQGTSGPFPSSFPPSGGIRFDSNFTLPPHAEIESGATRAFVDRDSDGSSDARNPLLPKRREGNRRRRTADGFRPAPKSRPRVTCDCAQSVSISTFRSTICEDLPHRTFRPNHACGGPSGTLGRVAAAATRRRPRRIASAACR